MHTFFVALGLRYPLVQAPMAGVQDARLAIAASRAGALGPTGVFNLNFFCHRPQPMTAPQAAAWREVLSPLYAGYGLEELPAQLPAHLAAALRQPFTQNIAKAIAPFRPPVLSFHFGLPEPALLEYARSWGARIIASATTVQEALWLQAHGADAIIAQGLEAGGHRGHFLDTDTTRQMGLFALLPQVVDAVRLPVIAAGGIAGPREVRAAFALGASAVHQRRCAAHGTDTGFHRRSRARHCQHRRAHAGRTGSVHPTLPSGCRWHGCAAQRGRKTRPCGFLTLVVGPEQRPSADGPRRQHHPRPGPRRSASRPRRICVRHFPTAVKASFIGGIEKTHPHFHGTALA